MQLTFLKKIVKEKIPCVFVSPHLDDAYLSCGTLISRLSGKTDITIINVFTQAHNEEMTLSAKKALRDAGYRDGVSLSEARKKEDAAVYSHYKVDVVNLGFQDALFRKKEKTSLAGKFIPELDHIYPTYRWHMHGKVSKHDTAIAQIFPKIKPYLRKDTLLFIPYGIGGHVDHMVTRQVCEANYSGCVYYADFPYTTRFGDTGKPIKGKEMFYLNPDMDEKIKMLQLYKTQFMGLFPGGIVPEHQEIFYW